jgi:hypothetical protein
MYWDDLSHGLARPVSWIGTTCVMDWDNLSWIGTTCHGLRLPVMDWDDLYWIGTTCVMEWDDLRHGLGQAVIYGMICVTDWEDQCHRLGPPVIDWEDLCHGLEARTTCYVLGRPVSRRGRPVCFKRNDTTDSLRTNLSDSL